jgi:putative intracellular protease/amidase
LINYSVLLLLPAQNFNVVIAKNIITVKDSSATNEFMKAFLNELSKNN